MSTNHPGSSAGAGRHEANPCGQLPTVCPEHGLGRPPSIPSSAARENTHSHPCGISNFPDHGTFQVVYINGIRTSESDAQLSAPLVQATLGAADRDLTVLYNPKENAAESGFKILHGSLSSSLRNISERETADALHGVVCASLQKSDSRLCIVGHSHGSLIVQNVLDRVDDEFHSSPDLRQLWRTRAPRIQVILYALPHWKRKVSSF